jgi:hypothetical protein
MRPGEVVILRAIDLDMRGPVWLYRPGSDQEHGLHKSAWRGHDRVIAIGPRAQEVIKPFLKTDLHAYLFSLAMLCHPFVRSSGKSERPRYSRVKSTAKRRGPNVIPVTDTR